ncbi:class I poly(R)-hydroxyalkanoic acid synthase [Thalassospiraceae bacterium LMO-SO8]|nr:class I poly(R)-hydroxyalkanoic acid synthase [Alphaproteobacteria bacterium LMO-S08]WND75525.1 class I poly(R)-hydroxyalkanoic acid synthase [Thalassospiraceae bacterium LMO-SO8]
MSKKPSGPTSEEDTPESANPFIEIAERSQRLVNDWLTRHGNEIQAPDVDPLNIGEAFVEMTRHMMANPQKMMESGLSLWQGYMELWQSTALRMMGAEAEPVAEPTRDDRRFRDEAWSENQVFDFIKQSYLLTAKWLESTVHDVEGLDRKTQHKVDFYTKQFVNALSPTNFLMTNPEALRATVESKGENLVNGLNNLLEDLERGDGKLAIRMTDMEAFEIGKNVATAKGKVIYRNDLIELIQFDPLTDKVAQTPLLIVPPWINKFYILDLRPENSFIRWASAQGHTVFVISWVNPDAKLARKTYDDYMLEGPLAAMDVIEQATGERAINIIGYCLGGTLTAAALAWMAAQKGEKWKDRVKSATFFTTMVDFAEAGDLSVFVDETQLANMEAKMNERGYLEGSEMATTFNMLRANDLIWSFVVNNYLLGKDPFPFDLLFWNSDSTRMPAAMHAFYLRNMYLENKLATPGGITLAGTPIDLTRIDVPAYMISTREDHIAPWKATYAATQIYKGPIRFVLSASGHIAGVINPPSANKYCYWTNSQSPKDPDAWFDKAKQHEGSWWPDWDAWVKKQSGKKTVPARIPGDGKLPALDDAPGTYVKVRVS